MDSESDSEQSGAEIEEKTKRIVENSPKMTPEKKSTPKKSSIENNLQKKSPNAKNTPTPQKDLKKKGSLSPQQILDEEDSPLKKSPKYDILDEEDDEKNVDNDDSKQEEDEIDAKKEKENEDDDKNDEKIDLDKEEEGTPEIQSKKRHRAPTKFDKELEESERAKFKRDRDLEIPIYEGENKQTSYSQIANLFNASFVKKRQELFTLPVKNVQPQITSTKFIQELYDAENKKNKKSIENKTSPVQKKSPVSPSKPEDSTNDKDLVSEKTSERTDST